jgi:hypothetical protein
LLNGKTWLDNGVVSHKFVEFRDQLGELAEYKEGTVLGPSGTRDDVASLAEQKCSSCDGRALAGFDSRRETIHGGVGNSIQIPKVC